jgi:hypothetical protein
MASTDNSWAFATSTRFAYPGRLFVWVAFFALSIPSVLLARKTANTKISDAEERYELFEAERSDQDMRT